MRVDVRPLLLCAALLALVGCAPPGPETSRAAEDEGIVAQGVTGGYWQCGRSGWWAATTYRSMTGGTRFECGSGICGDKSHTQPTSWVDIAGYSKLVADRLQGMPR